MRSPGVKLQKKNTENMAVIVRQMYHINILHSSWRTMRNWRISKWYSVKFCLASYWFK